MRDSVYAPLTWSKMRSSQGVLGENGPTRPNVSQMGNVRPTCRRSSGASGAAGTKQRAVRKARTCHHQAAVFR